MTDIEKIREAFINMIADSPDWKDIPDPDGGYVRGTFGHQQLQALMEALGWKVPYGKTPVDQLDDIIAGDPDKDPPDYMDVMYGEQ